MTPVWVFPAYPLLLAAPLGSNLIGAALRTGRLSTINAVPVALASVTVQGTGFLISFMVCAAFLYRLMTQKLPRDHQRPGVFISIGPGGFTCAGIGEFIVLLSTIHDGGIVAACLLTPFPVQLGSQAPAIFPTDFLAASGTPTSTVAMATAAHTLRLLSYMVGLWLWGLSVWFFLVSVGSLWKYLRPESKGKLRFQMTWFSFVFPNTALVSLRPVCSCVGNCG